MHYLSSTKHLFHLEHLQVGDLVTISKSEMRVKTSFENLYTILSGRLTKIEWGDDMRDMLGKTYMVLGVYENDVIALPSPNGSQRGKSQDGKFYFNKSCVRKIGM